MSTQQLLEIRSIADSASADFAHQLLVPQRHYVDVLLDLRAAATSSVVRSTIDERLRDIRFMSMIDAEDVHADLEAIVAISEIDVCVDMAWAELALDCACTDCAEALCRTSAAA
jgi:hypothetical protein